jgi:hypothetical protein
VIPVSIQCVTNAFQGPLSIRYYKDATKIAQNQYEDVTTPTKIGFKGNINLTLNGLSIHILDDE